MGKRQLPLTNGAGTAGLAFEVSEIEIVNLFEFGTGGTEDAFDVFFYVECYWDEAGFRVV